MESIICGATDVYFHDSDFGCVAGALGTLIVTADGGKTWKGTVIDGRNLNDLAVHRSLERMGRRQGRRHLP